MCMTGTGDTACCQIAATLQEQFGADCADVVWEGGDGKTGDRVYGTDRVRRRTSKGLIALGIASAAAVIVGFDGTGR
jgi:hypothetical protein